MLEKPRLENTEQEKQPANPKASEEKEQNEIEVGEILKDESKIFHGIGFDLIRLQGILSNGILSQRTAEGRGIDITRNYGGYNLNDNISVAESPAINKTYNFGAFENYIANGISFVIDGVPTLKAREGSKGYSGYPDEVFVLGSIPKENITGMMIPEAMLDLPLSKLSLGLEKMGYNYIDNRCRKIIQDLGTECDFEEDTSRLEELIKQKSELEESNLGYSEEYSQKRQKIFDQMEEYMQEYIEKAYSKKFNIPSPTLRDILLQQIPQGMNLYNSDGFPITIEK